MYALGLTLLPLFAFFVLLPLWSFRAWPVTPFLMLFQTLLVNSQDGRVLLLYALTHGFRVFGLLTVALQQTAETQVGALVADA